MFNIFITLLVSKSFKSKLSNNPHLENIYEVSVAEGALNPSIFNVLRLFDIKNILDKFFAFGIFQLFILIIVAFDNFGDCSLYEFPKNELKFSNSGALKLFISNSTIPVSLLNIPLTFVNFSAFQSFNIRPVNFEQPLNIFCVVVTFCMLK